MNLLFNPKTIYLIVIISTLIMYLFCEKKEKIINIISKILYLSFIIYFVCIEINYYYDLNSYSAWQTEAFSRLLVHYDKGFSFLMYVLSAVSEEFSFFKIIVLFLIYMCLSKRFTKNDEIFDTYIFFLLILSNPRILDIMLNSIRAGLAMLIYIAGIFSKNKYKLMVKSISITFHIALISVVGILEKLAEKINIKTLMLLFICSITLYLIGFENTFFVRNLKVIVSIVINETKGDALSSYFFDENVQSLYIKVSYLYYILTPYLILKICESKVDVIKEKLILLMYSVVFLVGPFFPIIFRLTLIPYILICINVAKQENRGVMYAGYFIFALLNSVITISKVNLIKVV